MAWRLGGVRKGVDSRSRLVVGCWGVSGGKRVETGKRGTGR